MSSSSVKMIGSADFRCDRIKGATEQQLGNLTPLQLNAVNQFTVQVVHTRGWNTIGGSEWLDY